MVKMLIIVLSLIFIIYIKRLVSTFLKLYNVSKIMLKFGKYYKDYPSCSTYSVADSEKDALSEIVYLAPKIRELLEHKVWTNDSNLSFTNTYSENYHNGKNVMFSLHDKHASLLHKLKKNLNPVHAVKSFGYLPSYILGFFGANLSLVAKRIFSALMWLATYLIKEHWSEIFTFLKSLL
jgi:hypothetical protein